MKLQAPLAYRRSLRFAVVMQILTVLLTVGVDDNGSFIPTVLAVWVFFWIGVFILAKYRKNPSKLELIALRYGPLAIFIVVFAAGQYL